MSQSDSRSQGGNRGAVEVFTFVTQNQENGEWGKNAAMTGGGTYADQVKKAIPTPHVSAIAKGEMQKRRVLLVRAIGMEGEVMGDLTEKKMVEKANLALEMMGTLAKEKPDKAKFVGASRMNGTGGVLYEMNEEGAAEWLRKAKVMELFVAKMGSMIEFKAQTYEIIVD